jgi:hypothetical protein
MSLSGLELLLATFDDMDDGEILVIVREVFSPCVGTKPFTSGDLADFAEVVGTDDATIEGLLRRVLQISGGSRALRESVTAREREKHERITTPGVNAICKHCTGVFPRPRPNTRYCSDACRQAAYRLRRAT